MTEENKKFDELLKKYNDDTKRMEAALEKSENEMLRMCNQLGGVIIEREATITRCQANNMALNVYHEAEMDDLKKQHDIYQAQVEKLEKQLTTQYSTCNAVSVELRHWKREYDGAEAELVKAREQSDEIKSTIDKTLSTVIELTANTSARWNDERQEMLAKIADLEKQLKSTE